MFNAQNKTTKPLPARGKSQESQENININERKQRKDRSKKETIKNPADKGGEPKNNN